MSVSSNVIAGGFFRQGEVLLQIDPSDYETGLKRAQANRAAPVAGTGRPDDTSDDGATRTS